MSQDIIFIKVKNILINYLYKNNLRKTPERFAILEAIYQIKSHFDVDYLYMYMKNSKYNMSKATIYNTLNILLTCNLISKIQTNNSKNILQFERLYGFKQHDHIICLNCGKVIEFCDPRINEIKNTISNLFNIKIVQHYLTFYGSCKKKRKKI